MVGGGMTLGERLGPLNMTVDKYHLKSQTGKGPEGVVRCFSISNHSSRMIWHHMQHVSRNGAKKRGSSSSMGGQPHVVQRLHILLGRRIQ